MCDHHHHAHKPGNFVDANREHFSAATIAHFEKPQTLELAQRATAAFRRSYDFDEDKTIVLDFACGTGSISRQLAPYCKSIVGVDISQPLVNNYNERVSNQGLSPEDMRAVCVELQGLEGELDGLKFDVVVCVASYHHFESIDRITKVLAFFLKPGGVLLVVDLLDPEDATGGSGGSGSSGSSGQAHRDTLFPEEVHHIVPHRQGFKSDELQKVFHGAELTFSIEPISKTTFHGTEATLFMAKGQKSE